MGSLGHLAQHVGHLLTLPLAADVCAQLQFAQRSAWNGACVKRQCMCLRNERMHSLVSQARRYPRASATHSTQGQRHGREATTRAQLPAGMQQGCMNDRQKSLRPQYATNCSDVRHPVHDCGGPCPPGTLSNTSPGGGCYCCCCCSCCKATQWGLSFLRAKQSLCIGAEPAATHSGMPLCLA